MTRHAPASSSYPLSYGQRGLWWISQIAPDNAAYNCAFASRICSPLDLGAFRRTFQQLVGRHPMLRTTYHSDGGKPFQRIHDQMDVPIEVLDAAAWSEVTLKEQVVREYARKIDLESGPPWRATLFQQSDAEHVFLFVIHHIACDLLSLLVLADEWRILYPSERMNVKVNLPGSRVQYTDFVQRQSEMLASPEGERLWNYWKKQLDGANYRLNLPTDHRRPTFERYVGASQPIAIGKELTGNLKQLATSTETTLYTILLAAFQVFLHRYTGQNDICITTPAACRNAAEYRQVVGFLVNMLVLRGDLSGNPSFRSLLGQARETVRGGLEHQDFPFALLVERLQPQYDPSCSPLAQVGFTWDTLPSLNGLEKLFVPGAGTEPIAYAGLKFEPYALSQQDGTHDLVLELTEVEGELFGELKYSIDLFDASTIARMIGNLHTLLDGIVANPEASIGSLPLLTDRERRQVVVEWNDTNRDESLERPAHHLFEDQVDRTPDDVAVVFEDQVLTYRELNLRANRLAWQLVEQGVGADSLACLWMERGLDFWISVLAVLKAGGAYLPIDPRDPSSRLIQILSGSRVPLVVTAKTWMPSLEQAIEAIPSQDQPRVCQLEELPLLAQGETNLGLRAGPGNLAYVIYTSGSTGVPKGAMVEHQGMLNHLYAKITDLKLSAADIVAQNASHCFDISVWQFFAPLLIGGKTHIFGDQCAHNPIRLVEQVESEGISVLEVVPAMLGAMLKAVAQRASVAPQLSALRWMISTGEALLPELCRRWLGTYPEIPMLNAYGPTECSDDVTHYAIHQPPPEAEAIVPVGRPIGNIRTYVLDDARHPVPVGVTGELYVGGVGVGRGYLNDAEKTAKAFVDDPFAARKGERLYKSGDLARLRPDGNIEVVGRVDFQVKIRGFRIELGEIESALGQHPDIRHAVVLACDDGASGKALVGYAVAVQKPGPAAGELRDFLQEILPNYMVPAKFLLLDELPLTSNGKVDRGKLPAPDMARAARERAYVAPRTSTEKRLVEIWQDVLERDQVGINDNFFDLGGHSLLAAELTSRVSVAYEREVSIRTLFAAPTIAELAGKLDAEPAEEPAVPREHHAHSHSENGRPRSRNLTLERRPLLPLMSTGEIAPVDAVALECLPTSLIQFTGLRRDEVIDEWFGNVPLVSSILETSLGRIAQIALPRFNSQLYDNPSDIVEVTLQGVEMAQQIGACAVSLTGLIASATDHGRLLARAGAERGEYPLITSGHATTASAVVLTIGQILARVGRDIEHESIGFLGLGSIGVSSLRLMLKCLPHPAEIILCDVYGKRDHLEAIQRELIAGEFQGTIRITVSQAEIPREFYDASLIIGATNVASIVDINQVQAGTLIVDDSAPHCFDFRDAQRRFREQADILFTEGGFLKSPAAVHELRYFPRQAGNYISAAQVEATFRPNPLELAGCVFSALLSACHPDCPPTLGVPELEACLQHYETLQRFGFGAADLHCKGEAPGDSHVYDDESIQNFQNTFGTRLRLSHHRDS